MTVTKVLLIYTISFLAWYITSAARIMFFQFDKESISYKADLMEENIGRNFKHWIFVWLPMLPLYAAYNIVVLTLSFGQKLLNDK